MLSQNSEISSNKWSEHQWCSNMSFVDNGWDVAVKIQFLSTITPRSRVSSDQRNTWSPILWLGLQSSMSTRFVILCKLDLSLYFQLPLLISPSCQPVSHHLKVTRWSLNKWTIYSFTSSANSFICTDASKISSISFMNNRNRMGSRRLPCGTHLLYIQSQTYNQRYLQPESYLQKCFQPL